MDTSKLSKKEMDELASLLQKAGVTPADIQEKTSTIKRRIGPIPDEYIIHMSLSCNLCGYDGEQLIYMKADPFTGILNGEPLKKIPVQLSKLNIKEVREVVTVCRHCSVRLKQWPKEKLIEELLHIKRKGGFRK